MSGLGPPKFARNDEGNEQLAVMLKRARNGARACKAGQGAPRAAIARFGEDLDASGSWFGRLQTPRHRYSLPADFTGHGATNPVLA
jgi:hypothetical protein